MKKLGGVGGWNGHGCGGCGGGGVVSGGGGSHENDRHIRKQAFKNQSILSLFMTLYSLLLLLCCS